MFQINWPCMQFVNFVVKCFCHRTVTFAIMKHVNILVVYHLSNEINHVYIYIVMCWELHALFTHTIGMTLRLRFENIGKLLA